MKQINQTVASLRRFSRIDFEEESEADLLNAVEAIPGEGATATILLPLER